VSDQYKAISNLAKRVDKAVKRYIDGMYHMGAAVRVKAKGDHEAAAQVLLTALFVNTVIFISKMFQTANVSQALTELAGLFAAAALAFEKGAHDAEKVAAACLTVEGEVVVHTGGQQQSPDTVH